MIRHELIKPISYPYNGGEQSASFIEMNEFKARHIGIVSPIKQGLLRAIKDQDTTNKSAATSDKKEDVVIEPIEIVAAMCGSSVDMGVVYDAFRTLMTQKNSGLCLIDGEFEMRASQFDELSNDDLDIMLGKYILDFVLASLQKKA